MGYEDATSAGNDAFYIFYSFGNNLDYFNK